MKIQFCGATKTVTGSCFYVDTGDFKFLVDCGAFQGSDELEKNNYQPFPFNPAEIDVVFLTHAHFDHCGRLPVLVKQGFKGKIIATQPTRDLTNIVLLDSANLQKEEYERNLSKSKDEKYEGNLASEGMLYERQRPLFTEQDVEQVYRLFSVYPYSDSVVLNDKVEFRMRDAGHILGSAIIELWIQTELGRTRKLVFSGDLGQPGARIVKDPDMIREADYVICESTYGDRLHRDRNETVLELLAILQTAKKEEGNVLIPSFALERTQEVLYEINLFVENRLLDGIPVYLDSPMASKATKIFRQYPDYYDEDAKRLLEKGDDPFNFSGLNKIDTADESRRLISKRGIVIIAGSGMCNGGRIVHHLKNNIENKKTHVVIVGYQVEGTLGRRLVDGEKVVRIMGNEYQNNAQIHTLNGFSAHADEKDLRYWLRGFGHTPKRIFLTHGEESIAMKFAEGVYHDLQIDTHVPDLNEIVELK